MKRLVACMVALLGFLPSAHAQWAINETNDASVLASNFLAPLSQAVTINSASFTGGPTAAGTSMHGPLGIADGIILTNGRASLALQTPGTNLPGMTTDLGTLGDPLCDALYDVTGFTTFDAVKLRIEISLKPGFDGISFQTVFGSEEYPEFVNSSFNDAFGVYLDGKQVVFDEHNKPITINGPFFNSEAVVIWPATQSEYDGSTGLLTTRAPASAGNHVLEIVICDAGDHFLDSGVVLAGLNGCVGDSCTGTLPCSAIDDDGDGDNSCVDCDDTDPKVGPSSAEVCDALDNNCNGTVDENLVCCPDGDSDGICDAKDVCPSVADPKQADADKDGVGDLCDNCPNQANPKQDMICKGKPGCDPKKPGRKLIQRKHRANKHDNAGQGATKPKVAKKNRNHEKRG